VPFGAAGGRIGWNVRGAGGRPVACVDNISWRVEAPSVVTLLVEALDGLAFSVSG
jgi:hypothetical protein